MLVNFDSLEDTSKIWIYQSNREFSEKEVAEIKINLENFIGAWKRHGDDLKASYQIKYNQFIVIAVDENYNEVSGCSIDASVNLIKQFEQKFAIDLTNKLNISFKDNHNINVVSMADFQNYAKQQKITSDTVAAVILNGKMAPGMQILVARKGKVVYNKSFGFHTNEDSIPVVNSDLYDIASVTKIVATLPLIMELEERNILHLNSTLGSLIHKLKKSNKNKLTVKEVLSHYGGLQPWIAFYKKTLDSVTNLPSAEFYSNERSNKFNIKVTDSLYLLSNYKDEMFDIIADSDLLKKKEYKYSDLPYFIFKNYLEDYYKSDLNVLTQLHFYRPMGANRTSYVPLEKFSKNEIVPTEKDNYYRHKLVHGEVHDMGAAMQGGIGGHAGVFSNANDIAKLMQMYLQKGYYGGQRYFQAETIDKFNHRYYASEGVRKGVGFDKPQLDENIKATCGCVSDSSFGHSGFTGTYTWADPESEIVYVFLSNRIFPTAENMDLVKYNIRTEIQQLIQDAIIE